VAWNLHFLWGMTLPLTKADQSRWNSIQDAFLQAVESESQKTTQDRVMEQTKAPFYFLKGAARASLGLLQKGIKVGLALWQDQAAALQSPKKYLAAKQADQQNLQTLIKYAAQNPRKFLSRTSEGLKDQFTQKTIEFLTSSKEKQAEIGGELAPSLALSYLGGQLGKLGKFSKLGQLEMKTIDKLPEGVQQAYDKITKTWSDLPEIAEKIGNGHAFEKHVLKGKEFPGIKTKQDLIKHIENVLTKPDEIKPLADGRVALWDETNKSVLIIHPEAADSGTIFVPKKGKHYFDGILK
jgi:hypothetical protein